MYVNEWVWLCSGKNFIFKNRPDRDFPGSPVVRTSPSEAGSLPGQRAKIPYAFQPKNQNPEQKQYCNKFNEDFKNSPPPPQQNL